MKRKWKGGLAAVVAQAVDALRAALIPAPTPSLRPIPVRRPARRA
jgi:hypothetical protein